MAPRQPGASRERATVHKAVAHVVPNDPREYFGRCTAHDFKAPQTRLREDEALADIADHVLEMNAAADSCSKD